MGGRLKKLRNFFLDLLFPIECLNCGREGQYLCDTCFSKISFNDEKYLAHATSNLIIQNLDKIYIAGDYEDPILKNLILKYKYNFISPLGNVLAAFLISFWKKQALEINDSEKSYLVIPIPLSKARRRWRGFNQAEIIARDFNDNFHYKLNLDLQRLKNSKPQASLNESERLVNMSSAFSWTGQGLSGQTIILIDDVITTGTTLNEAARVLKAAGAAAVYGLVLAKG